MVVFFLRNSRSPSGKIVPVTIALNSEAVAAPLTPVSVTGTQFPNLLDSEGNTIWFITLATTERDAAGNRIPPEIINVLSKDTVHLELEAALGRIGSKIDWGPLATDNRPPRLVALVPGLDQTTNVPITTNIAVRLQDPLPAAGMDLSTLNMRLDGFPIITGGVVQPGENVELLGNVFDLTIIYRPKRKT